MHSYHGCSRVCRLCHGLGRHASCGILMLPSLADFPTLVLGRVRVVACIRVCRSPSFRTLHGTARNGRQKAIEAACHRIAGKRHMRAKSSMPGTVTVFASNRSKPSVPRVATSGRAGEGLGRVQSSSRLRTLGPCSERSDLLRHGYWVLRCMLRC
jgi:hypothetical protein